MTKIFTWTLCSRFGQISVNYKVASIKRKKWSNGTVLKIFRVELKNNWQDATNNIKQLRRDENKRQKMPAFRVVNCVQV